MIPAPPAARAAHNLNLFRGAFDHAAIGMALVALDGGFLRVNRALCRLVGWTEEELLGADFQSITHPDDFDVDLTHVRRLLAGEEEMYQLEKRCVHKEGRPVWVLLSVSLVRGEQGEPLHFVAQLQDVTDRKRAEQSLRAANARFEALLTNLDKGILVEDEARTVLLANAAFCNIFELPFPSAKLIGRKGGHVSRTTSEAFADPMRSIKRVEELVTRRVEVRDERLALADGRTIDRDFVPVFADGEYRGQMWVYRDVTNRVEAERFNAEQTWLLQEANDRLAALAATDPLTGLPNRRALHERLDEALAMCGRGGRPVSLVMLDVDRFKQFNDTFGHPEGDGLLKAIAGLLRESSRTGDVPTRYGGEEFAILLPDTEEAGAVIAAERCRRAIEQADWPLRPVTASFGIATVLPPTRADESVAHILIAAADAALYRSKAAGRNRVTHADDPFEGERMAG